MDTSHSHVIAPVCARLKSIFEPAATDPMPVDLNRLLEALDDAYTRGDLFGCQEAFTPALRKA